MNYVLCFEVLCMYVCFCVVCIGIHVLGGFVFFFFFTDLLIAREVIHIEPSH